MARQITIHFQNPDQDQPEQTLIIMPGNSVHASSPNIWLLPPGPYEKIRIYANGVNYRWQHQNGNRDRPIFWLRTLFRAEYQRYFDRWSADSAKN